MADNILTKISTLHPNALVAWDRDSGVIREGKYTFVTSWMPVDAEGPAFWVMAGTGSLRERRRHDGIGCVSVSGQAFSRQVLCKDPNDPLEVKWVKDPNV